jgi:hypothetical protein
MQIEVEMNYEQFFEANRLLLMHSTRSRRWNFICAWYACPVLSVILVLMALWLWSLTGHFTLQLFWLFFIAVGCGWCRLGFMRRVRRVFNEQRKHLTGTMRLEPSGLDYVRADESANAHFAWTAFESWLDTPDSFLLFPSSFSLVRIPKEKLTEAEQSEVRGWIAPVAALAK